MGRYEEASKNIYNMVRDAVDNHFPDLADARFFIWMDSQKRTSSGKTVPGSILKANSVVNFLAHEDYDYVIKLDRTLFENISNADQLGLILHLLCHTKVVTKAEEEKYSLVAPDYPLFEQELELIPYWREFFQRLQATAAEVHEKTPAVPANSPDAPNMFPLMDAADNEPRACPYPNTRAEACGQCEEPGDCGCCCYGCEEQGQADSAMPEGCKSLGRAGEGEQEAA